MLSRPINLAIVDDHVLFRKTLSTYLSEQKNITVAVQSSGIFDLLHQLKNAAVDLLVMDVFMPDLNGNDGLRTLRTEYPSMKILVLSMSVDIGLVSDMMNAGIHGYISKADEPEELLQAIYAIGDNRIYRNRLFTEALYWGKQNDITTFRQHAAVSLNEREIKMIQLIWNEKSNKEIADELFLSVRSVEKIRQDMKEKLGVKSTVGMLKYAIDKKIVGIGNKVPDLIR